MLLTSDHHKQVCAHISNELWMELIKTTHQGIIQKINTCKRFYGDDEHILVVAGLYTYAIEEFGKLLSLLQCRQLKNSTKREVIYAGEFANHEKKFKRATEHLKNHHHEKALLLNQSSFTTTSFTGESFTLEDVVANMVARLAIFFSDLDENNGNYAITKTPIVSSRKLKESVAEFEIALGELGKL